MRLDRDERLVRARLGVVDLGEGDEGAVAGVMSAACPTRQVLDRVADKWTMLVITALEGGTLRISELRRAIDGITQKMLTQSLRGSATAWSNARSSRRSR